MALMVATVRRDTAARAMVRPAMVARATPVQAEATAATRCRTEALVPVTAVQAEARDVSACSIAFGLSTQPVAHLAPARADQVDTTVPAMAAAAEATVHIAPTAAMAAAVIR